MFLDGLQFLGKDLGLASGCVDLFFENLRALLKIFNACVVAYVADTVALVICNDTLAADGHLVGLAKELGSLLRMLDAVVGVE